MHTAVRKESRPRPRPLSNKTDWSHAKIKIGPRHQASLPRLDRRRPPPAEGRGGSPVADPAALEREMAIRGKDCVAAIETFAVWVKSSSAPCGSMVMI